MRGLWIKMKVGVEMCLIDIRFVFRPTAKSDYFNREITRTRRRLKRENKKINAVAYQLVNNRKRRRSRR